MKCKFSCAACCIEPSINSPIPGMPSGKPAGVRCVQLLDDFRCTIFGKPERPAFYASLQPSEEMCGESRTGAIELLSKLEKLTKPYFKANNCKKN